MSAYKDKKLKDWLAFTVAFVFLLTTGNPQASKGNEAKAAGNDEQTLSEAPAGRMISKAFAPKVVKGTITAYASTPEQTDGNPFVTASGQRVHDGIIAANGLPFGTVVVIPSLYGTKRFIVTDRMNSRYGYGRFDIWFADNSKAKRFGVKHVPVEIYLPTEHEIAAR